MKARSGGGGGRERTDIKPITGMFELLQEEGPNTKKEGDSTRTRTEAPRLGVVTRSRSKLCLSPTSWEDPNTEHITPEDCVPRRINSFNDYDPVVCVCTWISLCTQAH